MNSKRLLDQSQYELYREYLYARGFLITDKSDISGDSYPFYGQWRKENLGNYYIWLHKNTHFCVVDRDGKSYFLIGHAYNPFSLLFDEAEILEELASAMSVGEKEFWKKESELTGIFLLGWIKNGQIVCSGDAVGMQVAYYGTFDGHHYVSAFSNLVDDVVGLTRLAYVDRLIKYRFYRYFGYFLPGDLSPFEGLKRLVANHCIIASTGEEFQVHRYYPTEKIAVCEDDDNQGYQAVVAEITKILEDSMCLISKKWPKGRAAISVTGGKDSTTTLACAKRYYDEFSYFSYISAEKEAVDAYAAKDICRAIGVPHKIYEIPQANENDSEFQLFRLIMDQNFGFIGRNKVNEVQKRLALSQARGFNNFDVEVKSWVDEISRARYYKRYNKKKFPKYPTPRMLTSLYKLFFHNRGLVFETDKVFKQYLKQYYADNVFDKIHWCDLIYWEFSWGSGEALFLTSEQRISYEITIPYNNRLLLEKMLSVPLERRIADDLQKDIIMKQDHRISDTGISVIDVGYSSMRTIIERIYLEIHSRFPF